MSYNSVGVLCTFLQAVRDAQQAIQPEARPFVRGRSAVLVPPAGFQPPCSSERTPELARSAMPSVTAGALPSLASHPYQKKSPLSHCRATFPGASAYVATSNGNECWACGPEDAAMGPAQVGKITT